MDACFGVFALIHVSVSNHPLLKSNEDGRAFLRVYHTRQGMCYQERGCILYLELCPALAICILVQSLIPIPNPGQQTLSRINIHMPSDKAFLGNADIDRLSKT